MYNMSKYYSYIFYADRNVRPWMIQGYTLATFPKVMQYIFMHNPRRNRQENLAKIEIRTFAQLQEKGPCNDIIVFSRTAEDHMEHLERIFAALQITDLKVKVSKCEFFKKHVSYLGYLIGETGIHCDRSKVEAINKITTPTSIEEVHQFNGMCSYYWKFISHYSDISKCFNDMTKRELHSIGQKNATLHSSY